MLPILGFLFLSQQAAYFSNPAYDGVRTVDHLRVSAWIVISVVLLLVLATGGLWFTSARVRALINDEAALANRDDALRVGFILTMVSAIGLYFVSLFEPLGGREVVHILMSVGIGAAVIRFGFLERRAHRDG